MKILDGGRISIAALSQGISMGAFKIALNYSKQREQFGKKISEFQAISFKLADMYKKIEASEMLIYQLLKLKNQNKKVTKESAMAKFYSSESCVEISSEAVQILGGYGYTKDFPMKNFIETQNYVLLEKELHKFKNKSLVIYYLNNNTIFAGVKLIKC